MITKFCAEDINDFTLRIDEINFISSSKCCSEYCFKKCKTYKNTEALIIHCRKQISRLDKEKAYLFLREKVEACLIDINSNTGFWNTSWTLSYPNCGIKIDVCRDAFRLAYNISEYQLTKICNDIKADRYSLLDKKDILSMDKFQKEMINFASTHKVKMTKDQIAAAKLPDTNRSLICYHWMVEKFSAMCDSVPTLEGIMEMDPVDINEIYQEYNDDMTSIDEEIYSYASFTSFWQEFFPHVKIRTKKTVSGKCETCSDLNDLKKNFKDNERRKQVNYLKHLHRTAYMNEKRLYYARRLNAKMSLECMSIIFDGMAQAHCELPHEANIKTFDKQLQQHIQTCIDHGKSCHTLRTFHTLKNESNIAIHNLLLTIENRYKDGNLPPILYLQVDGGAENTSKALLGMVELMVSMGLFKEIYWTRLPVGHTHEDIDAKFSQISSVVATKQVRSPQQYKAAIMKSLQHPLERPVVVDVFTVPDYSRYISGCVDPDFSNYRTGKDTQHQFYFRKVTVSPDFPSGVKVTYRKYAADSTIEIVPKEVPSGNGIYLEARQVESRWYPEHGFFLLHSFPSGPLMPVELVQGSHSQLMDTLKEVKKRWAVSCPNAVEDWVAFVDECPKSDDLHEYLQSHELYIPLKGILFKDIYAPDNNCGVQTAIHNVIPSLVAHSSVRFAPSGITYEPTDGRYCHVCKRVWPKKRKKNIASNNAIDETRSREHDSSNIPGVSTTSKRSFSKSSKKILKNYEGDTSENDEIEDEEIQASTTQSQRRRYDRRSSSKVNYQEAVSSEVEVNGSGDDEEKEEERDIEGKIEDYVYLIGTQHYDDEDDKVYETISVVEEGENIVGYRRIVNNITNSSSSSSKVGNKKDKVDGPIHIRDIQKMTKDHNNNQQITTKQQQKRQRRDKSNSKRL